MAGDGWSTMWHVIELLEGGKLNGRDADFARKYMQVIRTADDCGYIPRPVSEEARKRAQSILDYFKRDGAGK